MENSTSLFIKSLNIENVNKLYFVCVLISQRAVSTHKYMIAMLKCFVYPVLSTQHISSDVLDRLVEKIKGRHGGTRRGKKEHDTCLHAKYYLSKSVPSHLWAMDSKCSRTVGFDKVAVGFDKIDQRCFSRFCDSDLKVHAGVCMS